MHHVHSSRVIASEIPPAASAGWSTGEVPARSSVQSHLGGICRAGGREADFVRFGYRVAPAPQQTADGNRSDETTRGDDSRPEDCLQQPEPALDFRDLH